MKTKRTVAGLLLAVTVTASSVLAPMGASAAKGFSDVSYQNPYYGAISEMTEKKIISGYEDGTFKPNQIINRKQAAALVNRAVSLPRNTSFSAPKDLSVNNPYYSDIKKLMEAGVLKADSKNNIRPNAALTRGEMAKILTVAFDLDTSGPNPLKGVSSSIKPYVTALYNSGVTTGFEDGTFKENQSLSRVHYAAFMHRAMNLGSDGKIDAGTQLEIDYSLSYIGKYGYGKVPLPAKYKGKDTFDIFELKDAEYNKLRDAMRPGSYKTKRRIENPMVFAIEAQQLSKASGVSTDDILKYVNESAKTGNTVNFTGTNGQKYFVIFEYRYNILYMGENHLK